MVEVNPKLTTAKLKKGARTTSEGKGIAPLPGIKTDAKQAVTADPTDPKSPFYGAINCDPKGYGKNRVLAERISKVVRDLKANDEHGPRFVLAWRLYPNDEHPCWHQKEAHFCGCGCGCFAKEAPKSKRKPGRHQPAKRRTRRA
jgi:hypothetical protein